MEDLTRGKAELAKPKPPKKPPKRSWVQIDGTVHCFKNPMGNCFVRSFVEAQTLTAFHDATLTRCTKELNAILSNVERATRTPIANWPVLRYRRRAPPGLGLPWRASGPDGSEMAKALGLE